MRIYSKEHIYQADKVTLEKQGISSWQLMERAAEQLFRWLSQNLTDHSVKIHVFCGIGNNGGDGLALARMLHEADYQVQVYVVDFSKNRSADFLENLNQLKDKKLWPDVIEATSELPALSPSDFVVDAIFGIGLNRPAPDWVKKLMQHINQSQAFVLAIDVPSGLYLDAIPEDKTGIVKANYTLSFQVPKLIFFLPEIAGYIGQFQLLDIGLDKSFLQELPTQEHLITADDVRGLYRPRSKFSHKGTYGHCLVIGGSYGKLGSTVLATRAAMRVGAGKVTTLVPNCGYSIMQTTVPEAMTLTDEEEKHLKNWVELPEAASICFGIGVGTHQETRNFMELLLKNQQQPLVVDADGINLLGKYPELLPLLPEKSILTPHPKELERLIGTWKDDFDKLEKAKAFSKKYKIILVIKGAYSICLAEESLYVNTTGNAGMATAGSGDVLSGMLAGLISQGYDSATAAVFGVYLHGLAGDLALKTESVESLLAGDLITELGAAFKHLLNPPQNKA